MTMLEKAARAARDQRVADDRAAGLHHQNGQDEVLPIDWRQARAMLAAIRDLDGHALFQGDVQSMRFRGDFGEIWRGVIDAILQEKP